MKAKLVMGFALLATATAFAATREVHREFTVGERPCLVLQADPAHLIVESGDSGRIIIDIKLPPGDIYTVSATHASNKVTIKLEPKGTLGLLIHNLRLDEVDIRITAPQDCDIVLLTRSGVIEIGGAGEIRSRSGSKVGQILKWVFRIGNYY